MPNANVAKIVVLAEDSQEIGLLVTMKLHQAGFIVVWEKRGDEAFVAIKKHRPCLVVSDLDMPGMTGLELIEAMRGQPDVMEIPIVILTASSSKIDVLKAKFLGVVEYVVKPFRVDDFMRRIHRLAGSL